MADWTKGKQPVRNDGIYELVDNEQPASTGLVANNRDATKDETQQAKRPTATDGDENKVALDVSISDGDGNSINKDNPVPVYLTDSPATEIEDYDVQEATKNGGTVTHDYLTTAEFRDLNVECSSAGYAKFELLVEDSPAAGTYSPVMTKFNSVSNPNVEFKHKKPQAIVSGVNIRVIKTNLDNQDTDMYSIVNGTEV